MTYRRKRKTSGAAKKAAPKRKRTSIKLNKDLWLTSREDIRKWSDENKPEDDLCPILKSKATRWTCDHSHSDLRVRGMISQASNTWEGYVTKYFNKYCSGYTEISISEALRNLADYLEQPYWLYNPLHCKGVEDMRKHLERCKKETIALKSKQDFNIELNVEDSTQEELIVAYLTEFIKLFEDGKTL